MPLLHLSVRIFYILMREREAKYRIELISYTPRGAHDGFQDASFFRVYDFFFSEIRQHTLMC